MIVYIPADGTAKNYIEMDKETALAKFGDEIKEGGLVVLSIEDNFVEQLKEVIDEDDEDATLVEWEEIGRDFSKE